MFYVKIWLKFLSNNISGVRNIYVNLIFSYCFLFWYINLCFTVFKFIHRFLLEHTLYCYVFLICNYFYNSSFVLKRCHHGSRFGHGNLQIQFFFFFSFRPLLLQVEFFNLFWSCSILSFIFLIFYLFLCYLFLVFRFSTR